MHLQGYTTHRQIRGETSKTMALSNFNARLSETCFQHHTIEFEVRQIPSSEIIERDRFLHVYWNFD